MIFIAHRGNLNGRIPEKENHPDYIDEAIRNGYDVEVDIWVNSGYIFLGHDAPQYEISYEWLTTRSNKLWAHLKNISAVEYITSNEINYFWHQTDTITLTSHGYIWVFPGYQPIKNSIAVLPEIHNENILQCVGACSDTILSYREIYYEK